MSSHQRMSVRLVLGSAVALVLLAGVLAVETGHARTATRAKTGLDASIFSYDGKEFTRTKTTLMTEAGKSAVGTKLDHRPFRPCRPLTFDELHLRIPAALAPTNP